MAATLAAIEIPESQDKNGISMIDYYYFMALTLTNLHKTSFQTTIPMQINRFPVQNSQKLNLKIKRRRSKRLKNCLGKRIYHRIQRGIIA